MNEHFIYDEYTKKKTLNVFSIIRIPKPNVCDGVLVEGSMCVNVFANARVIATKKSCVQFSILKSMFGIKIVYSWL